MKCHGESLPMFAEDGVVVRTRNLGRLTLTDLEKLVHSEEDEIVGSARSANEAEWATLRNVNKRNRQFYGGQVA
ncbi:MAG: hypothetical protein ACRD4V_02875 [Candidatus Acidiferrales bacterium]